MGVCVYFESLSRESIVSNFHFVFSSHKTRASGQITVCVRVHMYVRMCIYTYACMYVIICVSICVCVCVRERDSAVLVSDFLGVQVEEASCHVARHV